MPIVKGPQCYKHSDPLLRKVLKVPITQRKNTQVHVEVLDLKCKKSVL